MADPQRAHEPSMEEILASIRRIISDDGEMDEAGGEAEAGEDHGAGSDMTPTGQEDDGNMAAMMADTEAERTEAEPGDEQAAVDEMFAEAGSEQADQAGAAGPADEDVFELTPAMAASPAGEEGPAAAGTDFASIYGEDDGAAAPPEDDIHFADIKPEAPAEPEPEPVARPEPAAAPSLLSPDAQATASAAFGALASTMLSHSGGARTLEQIVEDLLRPLLKAWLDDNLPPMVERMVREEIERVARRAH